MAMPNQTISLPDGRALGYASYGDPDGVPILCFFGLASRRFYPFDDAIAAALHVHVITLDRPGLGLSDPKPGRTLLGWPADVAALADSLGLRRFGLLGIHSGGRYAAACACRLADRTSGLGLVSAPAPPGAPLGSTGLTLVRRLVALVNRYADRRPPATHAWIKANPIKAWQRFHHDLPEADREIVRAYGPRYLKPAFMRDILDELYRQGLAGAGADDELLRQPWGFDPADIRVPARLWHGEADATIPPAAGRYLARVLRECQAHFLPAAGHWFYLARWREILGEVAGLAYSET